MQAVILFGVLLSCPLMAIAKRAPALVRNFRLQSFFLFLATLSLGAGEGRVDLYIIAGLLFLLKVLLIPEILYRITRRIKANENIGLFINAQLSLFFVLGMMYAAWVFSKAMFPFAAVLKTTLLAAAFCVVLSGMFLMIFRISALAQIIGMLVMENGIFLLASTVSGGMPFFVEIAIFFDVFVSVVIMGFFVYQINKLFTHINVNKLSRLKG
ncbi:MAG: hypothetical protein PHT31_06720 [Candidatus Omnitrophica bacterium]|nr:hypothetical protein [Candidatus Omnitrophota bacterium]MDD5653830.1 hypothetical protein [Candidatus Omnitrophota bacterium]